MRVEGACLKGAPQPGRWFDSTAGLLFEGATGPQRKRRERGQQVKWVGVGDDWPFAVQVALAILVIFILPLLGELVAALI